MKEIGRAMVVLFLAWLTWYATSHPWVPLLDETNLIFHEAGHTLMPFGEIVNLAAGSFFQLLIPFVVAISFLRKGEFFSASVALWWMGESMLGVGRYVADARAQELPLLGGDHDFAVLFTHWPWLFPHDTLIGGVVRGVGVTLMLFSLTFCLALIMQYRKTPPQAGV